MSRFWAGDDSGSSSAESDSGSESEQEKKVQTNRWAAVSDSDSSDEGERVVRSAKDKAWDGMKAVVSKISNARKINDWHEMQTPVWKSTSASGAPDNSSLSHFSAMTRPCRLRRAVTNRHRHAIEQASRRWRGGQRDDSARTRRKILISTQVLLTHDGRCKVTDFGLSRCEELKTFTTTATMRDSVAGTPAFMAPELFEDNTFTEKSDVYSYAVVLWEIYDRGIPWAGLKPQQILYKLIKEQRLDVPKSMPRDLSSLMERAWAQDPDARPSFADICKELQATTPRRPSSTSRPWSASSPTAGDAPSLSSVVSGQGSTRSLASSVMNMFRAAQSDEAASKSPADAQSAEEDASSASPAVKGGVEAAAKSPVDAQSAETDASRASPAIKGGAKAAKNADSTSRINTVFEPMRTWYGAPARAALKKKHGAYPATPEALATWKSFGPVTTAFLDDQGVAPGPTARARGTGNQGADAIEVVWIT